MKKHIAEDLPARKHPPAAAEKGSKDGGGEKKGKDPKDRVRQAVYDIRYRARREELPIQQAYSQYMQNSNMSQEEKTEIKGKLFGKGPMKEDFQIGDFASNSVAKAMYKVFIENYKKNEEITLGYLSELSETGDRKYKVRVTGKEGRSYVRYATREKINSLRANPNIESVEMTEYGEPYEGEKKKGEQTAAAKAGKDYDGDGKVESGAKEYRGAVHNAIQRKKGGVPDGKDTSTVKEEFIGEVNSNDPTTGEKKEKTVDVMKGSNKIVISPDVPGSGKNDMPRMQMAHYDMEGPFIAEKAVSQAQQKFMGMVYAAKKGEKAASPEVAKAAAGISKGEAKKFAKTKHKGLPVHKEETECEKDDGSKLKKSEGGVDDPRQIPTKMNLVKNKFRSMGLKMSYEPEGQLVDEGTEEAQERRFQKRGDRSEGETHTRLIGKAARAKDSLEARRKRFKPGSPGEQKLASRSERMGQRMDKLMKARQKDKSKFRQGAVGSPKPKD